MFGSKASNEDSIIKSTINLNIAEKEIVNHLMEGAEVTEEQAVDQVLSYIREQVIVHENNGNFELAQHLLERIGEWNDVIAERYETRQKTAKIYLPNS